MDRMFDCGLNISYDHVLRLSAEMENSACQLFQMEQVVCPELLRGNVFTIAAVDNIDHNPSSTTAKDSFHGTGISLIQHPSSSNDGVVRGNTTISHSCSKTIAQLLSFYAGVPPVTSGVKGSSVPTSSVTSLERKDYITHTQREYKWLENGIEEDSVGSRMDSSWAAYHAKLQPTHDSVITPTALIPLFHENASLVAMIKHSMDVVKRAVDHFKPQC